MVRADRISAAVLWCLSVELRHYHYPRARLGLVGYKNLWYPFRTSVVDVIFPLVFNCLQKGIYIVRPQIDKGPHTDCIDRIQIVGSLCTFCRSRNEEDSRNLLLKYRAAHEP